MARPKVKMTFGTWLALALLGGYVTIWFIGLGTIVCWIL